MPRPNYLKVFINRLRHKLGNRTDVPVIRTERRIGYRLDPALDPGGARFD